MAEAHGNRTHRGDFSSPPPVLKTGQPTSDRRASAWCSDVSVSVAAGVRGSLYRLPTHRETAGHAVVSIVRVVSV